MSARIPTERLVAAFEARFRATRSIADGVEAVALEVEVTGTTDHRVADIIEAVSAARGVTRAEMTGSSKVPRIVEARREVLWLLLTVLGLSFREAGKALRKSHVAALVAVRCVQARVEADPFYRNRLLGLAGGRARKVG